MVQGFAAHGGIGKILVDYGDEHTAPEHHAEEADEVRSEPSTDINFISMIAIDEQTENGALEEEDSGISENFN
jgi:hypothetical protein